MDEHYVATRTWRITPDLMCILNPEGRFVAVNPAWQATLGWRREEMVGEAYTHFLHPDDLDRSLAAFEQVRQGQPVLRFENRYRCKDGGYRWLSWVAVPEDEAYYCTSRDITADKERAQKISDQQDEAQLREQFLAVLGHDLRNPLGSIISGVRILSRSPQEEGTTRILQSMRASSVRMSELIVNMMDFARVRLGDGIGLEVKPHPDFKSQILQVIDEIDNGYPDAKITFTADLDGVVECDAPRVMQVLSNLIGNAATHGTAGEPISVSAEHEAGRLKLSVSNSGEPIPEAARENLFLPFFKGNKRSSPQGLGLGLYISSQIAEAHGGRLNVTSDAEQTRFELDIPA